MATATKAAPATAQSGQRLNDAIPCGWVDRLNDCGGWPELYARLDALKLRISRLSLEPQPKPTVSSGKQQVPKWI
jgi:hypothetical protein